MWFLRVDDIDNVSMGDRYLFLIAVVVFEILKTLFQWLMFFFSPKISHLSFDIDGY